MTGQVQYHIRTPWVSACVGASRVQYRCIPGNLTEAETIVPQNQRLQFTQRVGARTVPRGNGLPKGYCTCQSQQQQKWTDRSQGCFLLRGFAGSRIHSQFKFLWEGSISNSWDPWSYWYWISLPLWLSIHRSNPVSLEPGVSLSST